MTHAPEPASEPDLGPLRMEPDDRGTYLVTIEGSSDVIATISPSGAELRWHHLTSGQFGQAAEIAAAGAAILELERNRIG